MKLILLFLLATAAHAQAHLEALPAAQIKVLQPSLTLKLLPPKADSLTLEPRQAFLLQAPGAPPLTLVASRYYPDFDSGDTSCGVFFAGPNQPTHFVRTYNLYPDSWGRCGSTSAVGLMTDAGPRPRIILIYNAYSPPRHSWQEAVVLKWDAAKSTYVFDQSLPAPEDIVGVGHISVAEVRRMLRKL